MIAGSGPIVLRQFRWGSINSVFVSSDKPTVIFSQENKLTFVPIFIDDRSKSNVTHSCPLNAEFYPNSLILASNSGITICTVESYPQNLQIHSVHLNETPHRIVYNENSEVFNSFNFLINKPVVT